MAFDVIIAGCGFSGAVAARKLADAGRNVLILERRSSAGGNMADAYDKSGVLVHLYGPHIFHTGKKGVYEYIRKYSSWFPYEHRVCGKIKGKMVPVPFNFTALETLFPRAKARAMEQKTAELFPGRKKVSILELLDGGDADIREFGNYVFDNVFKNYTAKQWGTPVQNVDKSTINRVPVVLGYDDRYFDDEIQCMPSEGFSVLFRNLLNHPRIRVELNCDASQRIGFDGESGSVRFDGLPFGGEVIYTGAVDELLHYRFGPLPYRSVDMRFETLRTDRFQPAAVVNYPNEEDFTRITEFKQLTNQKVSGVTTILREYPLAYDKDAPVGNIPFYPILNGANTALYEKYAEELAKYPGFHLCGRLADYRYYNMDAAIERALSVTDSIIHKI